MRTELVLDALKMAIWTRGRHRPGRTGAPQRRRDAGLQYISIAFTERLAEAVTAPSVGPVDDELDNALAETEIGVYKTELVHRQGPWRAWMMSAWPPGVNPSARTNCPCTAPATLPRPAAGRIRPDLLRSTPNPTDRTLDYLSLWKHRGGDQATVNACLPDNEVIIQVVLKIGYKASAEQFGPRELVEFAVQAEDMGLDSVMISDHYQPWRHNGGHAPFSLCWLSAVGERTSRVMLGTSVMTVTFRYNPAVVAQAFGTLGCLYPGRVILGVGTGEALNEVAVSGIEWPPFKERFARLREAVKLIRQLWRDERVTFEGKFYKTINATVYDRPAEKIPIYIAAGGPLVAKYAGQAGDGFICTSGKGMELYTDKLIPAVQQGLADSSRTLGDIERLIEIKLSFNPKPQQALDNTRFWAPLALSVEQKHGLEDPLEMEAVGDALPIEQVTSRWIISSDPDDAIAAIKTYVDAGFNHLVFHDPGFDQQGFLTNFAEQLLPQLRALQQ
jgi:coenzyme F420-dependent glucose-6-phosphate dehydrogenase